jgi:hypothetical protein
MQPRVVVVEDELLASQFVGPKPDAFLPEKRLMAAVLAVALADYQKYVAVTDRWRLRRFAAIEAWFNSDDTRWPFSFVAICEKLGLDVPSIRAAIQSRRGSSATTAAGPGFFGRG